MRVENKKKTMIIRENKMNRFRPGIYTADTTNGVQYYGTEEFSDIRYMEEVDPVEFEESLDYLSDDRTIYTVLTGLDLSIWRRINKTFGIMESVEKKNTSKKGTIIEIQEDVRVPGTQVILEKGDRIEIFSKVEEDKEEDKEKV
jgi:hypothetical protein